MAGVALRNVTKVFGSVQVLTDINLEVPERELTVIVGPSGCGKSTLLRIIAGLDDVTKGEIEIAGRVVTDVPPAKRGIAMVFQSYALYPHMTVYDNMAFGLKLAKNNRTEIDQRVREAARLLHIGPLLNRKPKEISGGERQRVAMGRALVRHPQLFLFDEPLSNLDAQLRVDMRREITQLQRDLQATMIYVTHDQEEAMTLADKIVVMRKGRIEQIGSPDDVYDRPRNTFVAGFIGTPPMNFLPAHVLEAGANGVTVTLGDDHEIVLPVHSCTLNAGDLVTLGIRPQHLRLGEPGDLELSGKVTHVERLGAESHLHLELGESRQIVLWLPGHARVPTGERRTAGASFTDLRLFDASGGGALEPCS